MSLAVRFVAYSPNGGELGVLPVPSTYTVAYGQTERGALEFSYTKGAAGSEFLTDDVEVAVQLSHNGGAFTEPIDSRFLVLASETERLEDQTVKYTGQSYGFRLSKAVVDRNGTVKEGRRIFSPATPGKILYDLFQEAVGRGALAGMARTWNAATDSAGNSWTNTLNIEYDLGMDMWSIVQNLIDQGVITVHFSGRTMYVYNGDIGTDRTLVANGEITLYQGRDITEAPERTDKTRLADTAYVRGDDDKMVTVTAAGNEKPWGRWEVTINQGGVSNLDTLTYLGTSLLERVASGKREATRGIIFQSSSPRPMLDYFPGDWIYDSSGAGMDRLRVYQIALTDQGDGIVRGSIILNDRITEMEIALVRRVNGIVGGSTVGGGSGATPTLPLPDLTDTTVPKAPASLSTTTQAYNDTTGKPLANILFQWGAVTQNTDNSSITDLQGYEVVYQKTGGEWTSTGIVADAQAFVAGLEQGVVYNWKVKALDSNGHASTQTSGAAVTTAKDTTPPPAPTAPITSAKLSVATVEWDGNFVSTKPADFAYISIHRSTTAGFTPAVTNRVGTANSASRFSYSQEYGITWYYKFVAYDTVGNVSAASLETSCVVSPVANTDLANQVFDDIAADIETARSSAVSTASGDATTKATNAQNAAVAAANLMSNKINNPGRTASTSGWSVVGSPATLAIEDKDFFGTTVKAMKVSSSGDSQIVSDYFDVDVSKAYEVRLWALDPVSSAGGSNQFYLGLNGQTTAGAGTSFAQIFPTTGGNAGADTTNFYAYLTTAEAVTWREHVFYVFPYGATAADMKGLGTNVQVQAQFKANTAKMRVRFLNWNNAGTSRDIWMSHAAVREMSLTDIKAAATVESWRAPGKTTINGGLLETDTVDAKVAIKSRTIGAQLLAVGSMDNQVPNGTGEFGVAGGYAPSSLVFDSTDKPAELRGVHKCAAGTGTQATNTEFWNASPGEEFLVEIWLKADKPNSRMYVELRDQLGGHAVTNFTDPGVGPYGAGGGYAINNLVVPTTWTKYTAIATADSDVTQIRVGSIYFNHLAGTERNAVQSIAIRVRRRNAGLLIVDGTLEAKHMKANSITVDKLAVGFLDGEVVTGALIRTAASGARWELGTDAYQNTLRAFTNKVGEVNPAVLRADTTYGGITLEGSDFGTIDPPKVQISSDVSTNDVSIYSKRAAIITDDAVDLSAGQTMLNIDGAGSAGNYGAPDGVYVQTANAHGETHRVGKHFVARVADVDTDVPGELVMKETSFEVSLGNVIGPVIEATSASTAIKNLTDPDDTGWVDCTPYSGFAHLNSTEKVQVRKRHGVIYIRGAMAATGIGTNNSYTVASLPGGFAPPKNVVNRCGTSSGAAAATAFVTAGGDLQIRTNGTLSAYYFFGGFTWLLD